MNINARYRWLIIALIIVNGMLGAVQVMTLNRTTFLYERAMKNVQNIDSLKEYRNKAELKFNAQREVDSGQSDALEKLYKTLSEK